MIKVGIIGTHDTRKTSLCYDLASKLKDGGISAGFMEEVARNLPASPGFKINEKTTRESQIWILHSQIKRELEYAARGDIDVLFTDRTVIDNWVYYLYRFKNDNPTLDSLVNYWTKTYNLLVKLPILKNKSLKADPKRAKALKFKLGIDELLEKELIERGIPFDYYTTRKKVIERVKALLNIKQK